MVVNRRKYAPNAFDTALDDSNLRLLAELQADGRLSFAELGRRVGLSPPAVAERVARLEQTGVITGYRAEVDPRAVGLSLGVVIRIRPAPRELYKVAELARDTPEVVECHRITGEDCYFVKAFVRDVEHLEQVIDQFAVYGQTTSSIMQTSPVPSRAIPVQAGHASAGDRGREPPAAVVSADGPAPGRTASTRR